MAAVPPTLESRYGPIEPAVAQQIGDQGQTGERSRDLTHGSSPPSARTVRVSEMLGGTWLPGFLVAPVKLVVHLSVPEKQHPSGVAGGLHGVGDHKNGLPCVHSPDRTGRSRVSEALGIQCAGGLVRQNDLGLGNEGTGHCGTLLLTAGDLVGDTFSEMSADAQLCRRWGFKRRSISSIVGTPASTRGR